MKVISKENLKLAGELFCKCIELTTDREIFAASLEFTAYVENYTLIIHTDYSNSRIVDNEFNSRGSNEAFKLWLVEMLGVLIEEKSKSDVLYSPENIEATKVSQKQEKIARLKATLEKLES